MSPHEQLVAARNLIDQTGWTCGSPSERSGPGLCVEEALGVVLGYPNWEAQSSWIHESEAYKVLTEQVGFPSFLYLWNDVVCRSKADALDLFDRAIAATAPEPDLNLNENGGRKDWNALEDVHAALREEVAR